MPFLDLFTHAGGATSRTSDLAAHLFAVIVTHACNLRLTDMARISGISYQQLAWARSRSTFLSLLDARPCTTIRRTATTSS